MYFKIIAFGRRFEAEYAKHPTKPAAATQPVQRPPDDAPTPMRTHGQMPPRSRYRLGGYQMNPTMQTQETTDA